MINNPKKTFHVACPKCNSDCKDELELDPTIFDNVHHVTCKKCRTKFVYFFAIGTGVPE